MCLLRIYEQWLSKLVKNKNMIMAIFAIVLRFAEIIFIEIEFYAANCLNV